MKIPSSCSGRDHRLYLSYYYSRMQRIFFWILVFVVSSKSSISTGSRCGCENGMRVNNTKKALTSNKKVINTTIPKITSSIENAAQLTLQEHKLHSTRQGGRHPTSGLFLLPVSATEGIFFFFFCTCHRIFSTWSSPPRCIIEIRASNGSSFYPQLVNLQHHIFTPLSPHLLPEASPVL